jgi:glucose/arabinose dehydrogenase
VFNEHTDDDGATCLQARPRGYRVEAADRAISIRPIQGLAQGQEPGQPGDGAAPGRELVELSSPEKVGPIWLVTQTGEKTAVANVPPVLAQGQGGMLGVFLSPHYAEDHFVYLTYAEPGDGGSSLALARTKLTLGQGRWQELDLLLS